MNMNRLLCVPLMIVSLVGCGAEPAARTPEDTKKEAETVKAAEARKLPMTEEEWKKVLTPEEFHVTRQKGTERAFTGKYNKIEAKGTFKCVCCGNELFRSAEKFDSGTGWPSFWAPSAEGKVKVASDTSHGMQRDEVVCQKCGSHLGHVFNDGPRPTGKRYCINSVSLVLEEKKDAAEPKK